jgi:predicted dehydrogenase
MTISWGILGAGVIAGSQMAPAIALASGHTLAAICSRNPTKAQQFAAKFGVSHAYSTPDALLADSSINAVYVATPPHLHAEMTIQAAEQGKHVLCEKPLALNSAQAQAMIDACYANLVKLMVCYYQRYNARHQQIKRLLAAGAIGQVAAIRINFSTYFPPQAPYWHHDPAISGGGSLMDLGVHCIDLVRYLCGPVAEVTALVDTLAAESPVEDTATLMLKMASGAHAVVTTHWSTAYFAPTTNMIEIAGTEGTIEAMPIQAKDSSGILRVTTAQGVQDFSIEPGGQRPHVALLEDFGKALQQNMPSPIPGEEGLAGLLVVEAAHRSARTGQRIRVKR